MNNTPSPYQQLKTRTLSALVIVFIVVVAIYVSAWSYFVCFLLVMVATMQEFYHLIKRSNGVPQKFWGIGTGILIYTLMFMYVSGRWTGSYWPIGYLCIAITYLIELYRYNHKSKGAPFANIAYTLLGIIYISGPFSLLHIAAFIQGVYNHEFLMGMFLLLWTHDTGAYLIGSSIGKYRLLPRVSPYKSWEGTLGGTLLVLAMSYGIAHYFRSISLTTWISVSCIIVIAGTYGDLVASMLKRSLHIKDSGVSIPGHGGFLDRFDSFLLAMPFIIALLIGIGQQAA